jgi:predicted small metal-binding protein
MTPHLGSGVFRVACGCGFAVEGDEEEVVVAARHHADTVHGISLADGIIRAMAHPVGSAPEPDTFD